MLEQARRDTHDKYDSRHSSRCARHARHVLGINQPELRALIVSEMTRMTMLTNVGLIVLNVRGVYHSAGTTFTHYQNGGHVDLGRMCSISHRLKPVFSFRTMTIFG